LLSAGYFQNSCGAQSGRLAGRPAEFSEETLLECLGNQRLTTSEWQEIVEEESGMKKRSFFALFKALRKSGKIAKSLVDDK